MRDVARVARFDGSAETDDTANSAVNTDVRKGMVKIKDAGEAGPAGWVVTARSGSYTPAVAPMSLASSDRALRERPEHDMKLPSCKLQCITARPGTEELI